MDQKRLKELFDYKDGRFIRKVKASNTYPGDTAGTPDGCKGYRKISVDGTTYKEHRLVWLYHNGEWPTSQIDHIDQDKSNNRIENLRDVCQTMNMYNKTHAHASNGTGYLGVSKSGAKFVARLMSKGRLIHLGTYLTAEEANAVYTKEKEKLCKETLDRSA